MGCSPSTWRAGACRIVLPEFAQPSADLFVYYPNNANIGARRAFIDFLVDHFKRNTNALPPISG